MTTKRPTENIPFFNLCALAVPVELLPTQSEAKGGTVKHSPHPYF